MGLFDGLFKKDKWLDVLMDRTKGQAFNIVEAADKEDEQAKSIVSTWFQQDLINADQHNELRRRTYQNKAENGDPNAEYWMGFLCDMIDHDKNKAFMWFSKSAEHGNTEAMLALAFRYGEFVNDPEMNPQPVTVTFGYDKEKEYYWTERAANLGNAEAQYKLGDLYRWDRKYEEAIKWLTMSCSGGDNRIKIKSWSSLADIYRDKVASEYADEQKQEEMLLNILRCKQQNVNDIKAYDEGAFGSAAFGLGLLYYGRFLADQNMDNAWMCAYCMVLTFAQDNEYGAEYLRKLPFVVPEDIFNAWYADGKYLLFNPRW